MGIWKRIKRGVSHHKFHSVCFLLMTQDLSAATTKTTKNNKTTTKTKSAQYSKCEHLGEKEQLSNLPLSRFFITMRILAWLAISRSGVSASFAKLSSADASMRVVCHSISLNNRISPRDVSRMRVVRRSFVALQVGVVL